MEHFIRSKRINILSSISGYLCCIFVFFLSACYTRVDIKDLNDFKKSIIMTSKNNDQNLSQDLKLAGDYEAIADDFEIMWINIHFGHSNGKYAIGVTPKLNFTNDSGALVSEISIVTDCIPTNSLGNTLCSLKSRLAGTFNMNISGIKFPLSKRIHCYPV